MNNKNYNYPLMDDWNTEEIIVACNFYAAVEKYYENGIDTSEFMDLYEKYLKLVPAKMYQKQLDKKFNEVSGYSIYKAIQTIKKTNKKFIKG
ncbi:UPF0223 family protein [Ligilactobacillus hayakitensis]|nr:UPF0223 family protein [Ligilactobacillus hayakitensis]